jgi:eukaryotic-like serine/threonine-protein kinase
MTTSEQTNAEHAGADQAGADHAGADHAGAEHTGGAGPRIVGGRYRLAEQIGRGAMGTVWRARDELLDRDVAIKEVRLPLSVSEAERENSYQRTLREARTAARLSHPGVAAVYDVVEELGRPWIVMELINGRSLDQIIAADGPLSPQGAAKVGSKVLAALAAAHQAGVLHRDVKPSNVLLTSDGRAVLTDFGIATAEGDPSLTQTGMVMGSPGFLAPERIRGGAATPASDLWSLGATLYAAVEGKGPYDRGGGAMTTLAAAVTEEPLPPVAGGPLSPLLHALLNRDPAQRPSAAAAAEMLDAVANTGPGRAMVPRTAAAGAAAGGAAMGAATVSGAAAAGGAAGAAGAAAMGAAGAGGAAAMGAAGAGGAAGAAGAAAGPGLHASRSGTLPLAQTLRPSAILPPGVASAGSPPGVPTGSPPGAASFLTHSGTAPAAAPMGWPGPMVPGPMGRGPMGPPPMGPGQMGPGQMGPGQMGPGQMGPGQMGPGQMGPGQMGPMAAGPASMGPAPGAARTSRVPRSHNWIITLVIIGAAIFVVAAVAAAQIHRARSGAGGSAPPGAAAGGGATGQGAAGQGAAAAAGSQGRGAQQPASVLPAGFRWYTQQPGTAGSGTAGFSVAVPDGWQVSRQGMQTLIKEPGGFRFLELDLTPHHYQAMMAELIWLQRQTRLQGTFPGYHLSYIRPVRYQGTAAADWAFSWRNQSSGLTEVLDRAWIAKGPANGQSFAIYLSTPAAQWRASQPVRTEILGTFRPLP